MDDRDVVVRLGGVALKALKRPATSTQDSEFTDPDAAPYIGVLKTPTVKRSKIGMPIFLPMLAVSAAGFEFSTLFL